MPSLLIPLYNTPANRSEIFVNEFIFRRDHWLFTYCIHHILAYCSPVTLTDELTGGKDRLSNEDNGPPCFWVLEDCGSVMVNDSELSKSLVVLVFGTICYWYFLELYRWEVGHFTLRKHSELEGVILTLARDQPSNSPTWFLGVYNVTASLDIWQKPQQICPFSWHQVCAYYSIMVVYLYGGECHPLVNGRKHF